MISLVSIKKAIVSKLKKIGIAIMSNDIRSGFAKPAFFVQLMPISNDSYDGYQERIITVNIHYFSEDKTDLDNLKMDDKLNSLFVTTLKVNELSLPIYEKRSEIDDNILQFKFDLRFTECTPIPIDEEVEKYENMEELYINL